MNMDMSGPGGHNHGGIQMPGHMNNSDASCRGDMMVGYVLFL